MGIEFEKIILATSNTFWEMPDVPFRNDKGQLDYGSVYAAADAQIRKLSLEGLLTLTQEIITEGLDEGVSLSDVGHEETNPSASDILLSICNKVVSSGALADPNVSAEDDRRFELVEF